MESPTATFRDAIAKIKGDRDGRCRPDVFVRGNWLSTIDYPHALFVQEKAANCDDTIARKVYPHRNTSSAVLFVVNREKIDFILRGVLSIGSRDTSCLWLCRTRPRVRREVHAPCVAPITAVDDWKLHFGWFSVIFLCHTILSVLELFNRFNRIEFEVQIVGVKYCFSNPS